MRGLEVKVIVKQGRSVREFADIYRQYADGEINYAQMLELSRKNRGQYRPSGRLRSVLARKLLKSAMRSAYQPVKLP